ncbi:MAG TPA: ABC transporter permease, partial [Gaiellaceae bacterium]|nr:ABC transporter permease [Gaiellaceae bacterium]
LNFALLPRVRDTEWLALPLGLALVAITGGLALAIASLNVLFRDIEFLVAALLLPLFFLTPVLYPLSDPQIARRDWVVDVIHWGNPLSPVVEALHAVLFYGRLPGLGDTVYTAVAAIVALALGAWVFNRVDDEIAIEV